VVPRDILSYIIFDLIYYIYYDTRLYLRYKLNTRDAEDYVEIDGV